MYQRFLNICISGQSESVHGEEISKEIQPSPVQVILNLVKDFCNCIHAFKLSSPKIKLYCLQYSSSMHSQRVLSRSFVKEFCKHYMNTPNWSIGLWNQLAVIVIILALTVAGYLDKERSLPLSGQHYHT